VLIISLRTGKLLSYSFGKTGEDEEKETLTPKQLRNLTDSYVFCPKCGANNNFELSKKGTLLNYFCKICGTRLNDYWEDFQNNLITVIDCVNCKQYTFEESKFCISCGLPKWAFQVSKKTVSESSSFGKESEEGLFIYKRSKTTAEKVLGLGGLQVNPKHRDAGKMKTILCIGSIFLMIIAVVLMVILLTGWD